MLETDIIEFALIVLPIFIGAIGNVVLNKE